MTWRWLPGRLLRAQAAECIRQGAQRNDDWLHVPSRIRCLVIIVAVRQPFQVLVFPFRRSATHDLRYAIFRRRDLGTWQGLAGGGEGDETPEDAAHREAFEEAGISRDSPLLRLDTVGK